MTLSSSGGITGRRRVQVAFGEQPAPEALYHDYDYAAREAWGPWLAWAGLLVGIVLATYAWTLTGAFLWGDDANITQFPLLRAWAGLPWIWRLPHKAPQFSPLGYTLLLIEQRLWGVASARGYHAVSITLHAANALLLWTLLRKMSVRGAWLASAVFAVHPIQVQAVAWASQQTTLLGSALLLASAAVYARFVGINPEPPLLPRPARLRLPQNPYLLYALALLLFVAAVLSQPATAVLPLLLMVLIWWKHGTIRRGVLLSLIPLFLVSAITLAGAIVLGGKTPFDWGVAGAGSATLSPHPLDRLLIAGRAIWFYFGSIVWPARLAFAYPRWDVNPAAAAQYAWPAGVVLVIAVLWFARRRLGRAPGAAAICFVLLLLPGVVWINVVAQRDSYVANTVAYLAVAAVVTPVLSWLVGRFGPAEQEHLSGYLIAPWIAAAGVVALAVLTVLSERPYLNDQRLWADVITEFPRDVFAMNSLGRLELAEHDPDAAMRHFRRAEQVDPANVTTIVNIGRALAAEGNLNDAVGAYYRALQLEPSSPEAHLALAGALASRGQTREAIDEYQAVVRLTHGKDEDAHLGLGSVYTGWGRYDDAEREYREALRVNPRSSDARLNLATLLYQLGRKVEASRLLDEIAVLDPNNYAALLNASAMYGQDGQDAAAIRDQLRAQGKEPEADRMQQRVLERFEKAERYARQAIYLRPETADAYCNLGIALAAQAENDPKQASKMKDAAFAFGRAVKFDPGNARYRQLLARAQRQAGLPPG